MKVLFSSTAGTGHIHPLMPLAIALQEQGCDVRWALAAGSSSLVERRGIPTIPAGMSVPERMTAFASQFGSGLASIPPHERRAYAFRGHFAHLCAPRMLEDLREPFHEFSPDLVIREPAELASPALAESIGIPHATVAFSGAFPSDALESASRLLGPLWASVGAEVAPDLSLATHAYFHPFPPSMNQRPPGATVHDLRPSTEDGSTSSERPGWIAQLGTARPFVYVTFGTEMGPAAPWTDIIEGLSQLDAVDAVITVGAAVDTAQFDQLPPSIRMERYVPQSWLLPRASLVVSHAGAGTLLASAAAGVPQLLIPLGADQFENASAYVSSGAGLSAYDTTSNSLAPLMSELLHDGRYRLAAQKLAEEIASMPSAEIAAEIVRSLVA